MVTKVMPIPIQRFGNKAHFTILIMFLFSAMSVFAEYKGTDIRLFDSEEVIGITLTYDIEEFRTNRENFQEDGVSGTLTFSNGTSVPVEIIARGKGSLNNQNPPYKLKFKKADSNGTVFHGIKKIKAFPNSGDASPSGELGVKSNYLTYKLLEMHSPYAFKTRMFKVTYIDSANTVDSFTSHCFFLEPNKIVAKRYGMEYEPFQYTVDDGGGLSFPNDAQKVSGKIDENLVTQMTAFQFLIGNADYAIPGYERNFNGGISQSEKNMKMLRDQNGKYYPLAYDFDFSGLIDRQFCWWEIGNGVFSEERSAHTRAVRSQCNAQVVKKHFKEDLDNYYYKEAVVSEYQNFVATLEHWETRYHSELSELSPDYLSNIEIWISAITEVLDEEVE